jgi:hypothetical protein
MCQQAGFKFCLDTKNNRALPLDPACPDFLKLLLMGFSTYTRHFTAANVNPIKESMPTFGL